MDTKNRNMKVGQRIRNSTLQDIMDTSEYSSYSVNDGVKRAKAGMLVFDQISESTWECISVLGSPKKSCGVIRIGKGGVAY